MFIVYYDFLSHVNFSFAEPRVYEKLGWAILQSIDNARGRPKKLSKKEVIQLIIQLLPHAKQRINSSDNMDNVSGSSNAQASAGN